MPVATAVALAYATAGIRLRTRLLTPVVGDPAWLAALAGGLAAGVVGSLVEDSGPELLVVAVFALGCIVSYLWGRPRPRRFTPPTQALVEAAIEPDYSSSPGIGSIGSGP
jgi:hypothetical protein